MKPTVSIIVPSHQRPRMLSRCLRSIYEQDYDRNLITIYIQDSGSNGCHATFNDRKRKFNSKIHYTFANTEVSALNKGLEKSGTVFTMFLNDDDWLHESTTLSRLISRLIEEPVHGIASGAEYVDQYEEPLNKFTYSRLSFSNNLTMLTRMSLCCPIIHSGFIGLTNLMRQEHFNLKFSRIPDWDYYLRLSKYFSFGIDHKPAIYYTVHKNMGSVVHKIEVEDQLRLLCKQHNISKIFFLLGKSPVGKLLYALLNPYNTYVRPNTDP